MARIGTVAMGRMAGIGDDECPTGFFLDPSGAVCLPINAQSTTGLTDPNSYPYDIGGPVLAPPGSIPVITGSNPPISPTVGLPISLPFISLPPGVNPAPGVGLSTPVTCPSGWVAQGGVCVPVPTLIPGIPNWMTYTGIGLAAVLMMSMSGGRRR